MRDPRELGQADVTQFLSSSAIDGRVSAWRRPHWARHSPDRSSSSIAGLALRRPLARVPENALKFGVGVLLSAFGVFWVGEGLGYPWPGKDLAILGLATGFSATGLLPVAVVRRSAPPAWAGQAATQR